MPRHTVTLHDARAARVTTRRDADYDDLASSTDFIDCTPSVNLNLWAPAPVWPLWQWPYYFRASYGN